MAHCNPHQATKDLVLGGGGLWIHAKLELTASGLGLSPHFEIDNPKTNRTTNRVSKAQCMPSGEFCAKAMLSAQDSFRSTPFRLQEIAEDSGYLFLPYPKFNCELS